MNKEIKIIDLLNMIAEGKELPENIKYDTKEMEYDYNKQDYLGYYSNGNGEWLFQYLFDRCRNTKHFINDTVEIIEEDNNKIEFLEDFDFDYNLDTNEKCEILREWYLKLKRKQEEIIDRLNNME